MRPSSGMEAAKQQPIGRPAHLLAPRPPPHMTDVVQREKEARAFLEETLKEPVVGDLYEVLRNGQLLCKFINILKPGSVAKINTGKMPFTCMENIGSYITACKKLGLPDQYNFMTVDLWENKNMGQVRPSSGQRLCCS